MMKKYILPFLLLLLVSSVSHAQRENVWVFGWNAGLDFNQSPPLPITPASPGGNVLHEANASVCDQNGTLLFHTDGDQIWDADDVPMPNGISLTGISPSAVSSTQGALIIPFPNDSEKYYVFSLAAQEVSNHGKLYYSIVDMTLNNGMGDVISGQKGILVDSGFTEHMSAVAGNDCNIWVVLTSWRTDSSGVEFKSFEINKAGLANSPVVSHVGSYPLSWQTGSPTVGTICFSPNRRKLLLSRWLSNGLYGGLELYDFNPSTGEVSNQMILYPDLDRAYHSACFSPDNTKIYAIRFGGPNLGQWLVQYDISSNNQASIIASMDIIDSIGSGPANYVKLAPDGKIYYQSTWFGGDFFIGAINLPNKAGIACQPVPQAISFSVLSGSIISQTSSFPNSVPTIIKQQDTTYQTQYTTICLNRQDSFTLRSPLSAADYVWQDGSTDSTFTVGASGTFWVSSQDCHYYRVDTFKVTAEKLQPVIQINGFELSVTGTYDTYQWLLDGQAIPNATQSVYTVKRNGLYRVVVAKGDCMDTSDVYEVTNAAVREAFDGADKIDIYPNPASHTLYVQAPIPVSIRITNTAGADVRSVRHAKSVSVKDLSEGIYFIHIYNGQGLPLKVMKFVKVK